MSLARGAEGSIVLNAAPEEGGARGALLAAVPPPPPPGSRAWCHATMREVSTGAESLAPARLMIASKLALRISSSCVRSALRDPRWSRVPRLLELGARRARPDHLLLEDPERSPTSRDAAAEALLGGELVLPEPLVHLGLVPRRSRKDLPQEIHFAPRRRCGGARVSCMDRLSSVSRRRPPRSETISTIAATSPRARLDTIAFRARRREHQALPTNPRCRLGRKLQRGHRQRFTRGAALVRRGPDDGGVRRGRGLQDVG